MRYVKLLANSRHSSIIMYTIKIAGNIVSQINNKNAAFSMYRAAARDYKNKDQIVSLFDDDTLLNQKDAGRLLIDDVDYSTPNEALSIMMSKLDIDIKQLKILLKDSELQLSNSRIDGWIRPSDDRKYVQMHNDELAYVVDIMLTYSQRHIKTPANILRARTHLGLTQSQLAEALGMKPVHLQVSRWENGEAEMPDRKWQKVIEMLQ